MSEHHGIVYEWLEGVPAFAARDLRVFAPDGAKDLSGIKIWSLDVESIPQREMWKIDPYRGNFNLKSFISHFADWIDFVSPHLPLLRGGKVTDQLKVKTLIYMAGKRAAQEEGMKEWGYWDFNAIFDYTNKLPVPEARWNTLVQFLVQKDYLPQSARKLTPNNKRQLYNLAVKKFKDNRGGPTLHSFVKNLKTLLDMPKLGDWKQVL
jgi:hypothetical protein